MIASAAGVWAALSERSYEGIAKQLFCKADVRRYNKICGCANFVYIFFRISILSLHYFPSSPLFVNYSRIQFGYSGIRHFPSLLPFVTSLR